MVLASGCGKPPKLTTSDSQENAQKGDPWETAAKRLRKETDLKACKNVLASLNHDLTTGREGHASRPHSRRLKRRRSRGLVPLHPTDRDEIRSATFSPHDAVYLAECLYLRDAARSLAMPGLSPEQLADLGFAWVCRQVYPEPVARSDDPRRTSWSAALSRRPTSSAAGPARAWSGCTSSSPCSNKWVSTGCLIGPPSAR